MKPRFASLLSLAVVCAAPAFADNNCSGLPSAAQLKTLLVAAQNVQKPIGGLFEGTRMWGAVVNRNGEVCAAHPSMPVGT